MHTRDALTGLFLSAAILAIAGCASATPSSATGALPATASQSGDLVAAAIGGRQPGRFAVRHSWMSPAVKKAAGLIYVMEASCNCIMVYALKGHNQQPVGQIVSSAITSGEELIADQRGNVWAVNYATTGNVLEFLPGQTSPAKSLDVPGYPSDVAVSNGTIYVSNYNTDSGGPGDVTIYDEASDKLQRTLTDPSFGRIFSVAVDKAGDIFITGITTTSASFIGEFTKGSGGSYTFAQLGPTYAYYLLSIKLDSNGNLVARNDFASYGAQSIEVFSPPSWNITSQFAGPIGGPGLALNKADSHVYEALINGHSVIEYAYPSGKEINEIYSGLYWPVSVAVTPTPPLEP